MSLHLEGQAALTEREVARDTRSGWHQRVDQIGMWASGACAVHCLLMPLLLALFPVLGHALEWSAESEAVFVGCALVLSALSLGFGLLRHGKIIPAAAFWSVGAVLLIQFALFGEHDAHRHEEWLHAVGMGVGGALLALAHYANWRALKHCARHRH
jgi:hypothetical protein